MARKAHLLNRPIGQLDLHDDLISAERILPLSLRIALGHRAVVAWMLIVIHQILAIEIVHCQTPITRRTSSRPSTSRSISASVV